MPRRAAAAFRRFCRDRAFCFLALGYVLFAALGGLAFSAIELPVEKALRARTRELRAAFLEEHACVGEAALDRLLRRLLSTDQRGVSLMEAGGGERRYDFTTSLFFVIVTLSTTGYDFFTPVSEEAKLFCIFYCALGVPVTLFLLSCLSDLLAPVLSHAPLRRLQTHRGMPYARAAELHAALFAVAAGAALFLLPALVFYFLEGEWSFLDALFFCFLTLSTIGQGGYALGRGWSQSARETLKLLTTCYLMAGLVVLLTFRDTVLEVPRVQALIRLLSGPREVELKGADLDQLVLGGGGDAGPGRRRAHFYSLPISTISFAPEQPGLPSPDQPGPPFLEQPPPSQLNPASAYDPLP